MSTFSADRCVTLFMFHFFFFLGPRIRMLSRRHVFSPLTLMRVTAHCHLRKEEMLETCLSAASVATVWWWSLKRIFKSFDSKSGRAALTPQTNCISINSGMEILAFFPLERIKSI